MRIETGQLIIKEFEISDACDLLKIKYDKQVLKYNPEFIKQDADESDAVRESHILLANAIMVILQKKYITL